MKKSALQKARAAYQPKLPIVLTGAVRPVEGSRAALRRRQPGPEVAAMVYSRLCITLVYFEINPVGTWSILLKTEIFY